MSSDRKEKGGIWDRAAAVASSVGWAQVYPPSRENAWVWLSGAGVVLAAALLARRALSFGRGKGPRGGSTATSGSVTRGLGIEFVSKAELEDLELGRERTLEALPKNYIRFLDENGTVRRGEDLGEGVARLILGSPLGESEQTSTSRTREMLPIRRLLAPVDPPLVLVVETSAGPASSEMDRVPLRARTGPAASLGADVRDSSLLSGFGAVPSDAKHTYLGQSEISLVSDRVSVTTTPTRRRPRRGYRSARRSRPRVGSEGGVRVAAGARGGPESLAPRGPRVGFKAPGTVGGADSTMVLPVGADASAAAHLALVIARDCRDVSEEEAGDYVLGITTAIDIRVARAVPGAASAQAVKFTRFLESQLDGSCPVGPRVIPLRHTDLRRARVSLCLNSQELLQDFHISSLPSRAVQIVSALSRGATLPAGTLILTGTQPTAASRRTRLVAGDVLSATISGVGTLSVRLAAAQDVRAEAKQKAADGNPSGTRASGDGLATRKLFADTTDQGGSTEEM